MTDRWTQVLATLRERFTHDSKIGEIESYLLDRGLDSQEIGEVLSLYFGVAVPSKSAADTEADINDLVAPSVYPPIRVQGPHERGRFSSEAWGFLVELYNSGRISPLDFETLVDRALFHVEGQAGLAEIRAIADDAGIEPARAGSDKQPAH